MERRKTNDKALINSLAMFVGLLELDGLTIGLSLLSFCFSATL